MTFYSAKYLAQQTNINDTIGIYLMVIAFVFMAVGAVAFLRNRMQTRYRDLSIIALLLFLFLAGARYTDYQQAKSRDDQQTQTASFVSGEDYKSFDLLDNSVQITINGKDVSASDIEKIREYAMFITKSD